MSAGLHRRRYAITTTNGGRERLAAAATDLGLTFDDAADAAFRMVTDEQLRAGLQERILLAVPDVKPPVPRGR